MKQNETTTTETTAASSDTLNRRLKLIIPIRHGKFSAGEFVGDALPKLKSLAHLLRRVIPADYEVRILSSPTMRGQKTADVFIEAFKAPFDILGPLERDEYQDGAHLMNIILDNAEAAEALIVITHFESPSGIANAFAKKYFNGEVKSFESKNGDGVMIDLRTNTVTKTLWEFYL